MIVVIMGTPGSGKTTIGTLLAKRPRWEFVDPDDFHPAAYVEKMRQGIPRTDADREPWLKALQDKAVQWSDVRFTSPVVSGTSAAEPAARAATMMPIANKIISNKDPSRLGRPVGQDVGDNDAEFSRQL